MFEQVGTPTPGRQSPACGAVRACAACVWPSPHREERIGSLGAASVTFVVFKLGYEHLLGKKVRYFFHKL